MVPLNLRKGLAYLAGESGMRVPVLTILSLPLHSLYSHSARDGIIRFKNTGGIMPSFLKILILIMFIGCRRLPIETDEVDGGRDLSTIDLPFREGYKTQCVQGVGGSYSHTGRSTYYDADFDTPNTVDDPVFAPLSGVVYVHDKDPKKNFGNHLNFKEDGGTYIVAAHLKDIFVKDGEYVTAGEYVGREGSTGNSSGDHLHLGRHEGEAKKDAIYGTSTDGLTVNVIDATEYTGGKRILLKDLTCGLTTGHVYESRLKTPKWHPPGSLIKDSDMGEIYLTRGGGVLQKFKDTAAFSSRNYEPEDVALVSSDEMRCYPSRGAAIEGVAVVRGVRDSKGQAWILNGIGTDSGRERFKVAAVGYAGVMQSYGLHSETSADLSLESDAVLAHYKDAGTATYRDGTLLSPSDASVVYVMVQGVATPIESWEAFLLMGWHSRSVMELPASEIQSVVTVTGDCVSDNYCLKKSDVTSCSGQDEEVPYVERPVDGEDGLDTGKDDDPEVGGSTLSVSWLTPAGEEASSIRLSGEYVEDGESAATWKEYGEVEDALGLTYEFPHAKNGDSFRFSVEYAIDGRTSWSCLGPFPPGEVQGEVSARFKGAVLPVNAVEDPASDGCGLMISIPK
jgi:hypothetical protein